MRWPPLLSLATYHYRKLNLVTATHTHNVRFLKYSYFSDKKSGSFRKKKKKMCTYDAVFMDAASDGHESYMIPYSISSIEKSVRFVWFFFFSLETKAMRILWASFSGIPKSIYLFFVVVVVRFDLITAGFIEKYEFGVEFFTGFTRYYCY